MTAYLERQLSVLYQEHKITITKDRWRLFDAPAAASV